jgi:hypothetical protein
MTESTQPLITFCIPTYNRSAAVERLVTSILSCPDSDIEVAVLDNGSTDDTLGVLGRISDRRLRVRGNGENRGALFNMVNVFGLGTGKYLVYSTDQDSINPALIPDFKAFLVRHPGVSCGYCALNSAPGKPDSILAKGFECVYAIAYKGHHPTGYFFRNADLTAVRLAERFSDSEVVGLFPLEFAFGEIGVLGAGAIYRKALFTPNVGPEVVSHKSSTTDGASRTAFFGPSARLKVAIAYSRHIEQLQLSGLQKSILAAQVFMIGLRAATLGFRAIMRDERLCAHYRMQPRNVSQMEMLRIAASFCSGYFKSQFSHRIASVIPFAASLLIVTFKRLRIRVA